MFLTDRSARGEGVWGGLCGDDDIGVTLKADGISASQAPRSAASLI